MAWADSRIFEQAMLNPITLGVVTNAGTGKPTSYGTTGLLGDTVKCALFGTLTPDRTVAVTSTGYNTGVWTTTNESSGTGYTATGTALASKTWALDAGSTSICFGAANPSWTTATLSGVYGCLVYDSTISGGTVSAQGMCYNYFGGSQSVTAGTFTVQWAVPSGGSTASVFNISV